MQKLIVIESKPIAQKRARLCGKRVFNPQYREKQAIKHIIKSKWGSGLLTGPVSLSVIFYLPIPESWSKKKKLSSVNCPHINTPDIDNFQVFLLNCMTEIVYKDDRQVYDICASKLYSNNPRTEVKVIWGQSLQECNLENGQLDIPLK